MTLFILNTLLTMNTNQQPIKNTGRYSIGETLYAVAFVSEKLRKAGISPLMTVWGDVADKMYFVQLEVESHHRVPYDQDPMETPNCDGYILLSSDGTVFTNQYPRASYGQVSDTYDRVFLRDIEEASIRKALENQCNAPLRFILVTDIFAELDDVQRLGLPGSPFTSMKEFQARLLREFEEAFPGKTLVTEPIFADHPTIIRGVVRDTVRS